jgi:hypothetical protein
MQSILFLDIYTLNQMYILKYLLYILNLDEILPWVSSRLLFQVALNQWLHHNMETVVSMYEDRFDLCTFEKQPIDLPDSSQTEKQSWWRNLTKQHSKTMSQELHFIAISHFSMPVKRTNELRALTGWYVLSLPYLFRHN